MAAALTPQQVLKLQLELFNYLLEKNRQGYQRTIIAALNAENITTNNNGALRSIERFEYLDQDTTIPPDSTQVEKDIAKLLEPLSLNEIKLVLELFYSYLKNDILSPADFETRVQKLFVELTNETELSDKFVQIIQNYREAHNNLLRWYVSNADENGKLADEDIVKQRQFRLLRERLLTISRDYYEALAQLMKLQGEKTTPHLFSLTKGDLSKEGENKLFFNINNLMGLCGGKLKSEELSKDLIAIESNPVDADYVNSQFKHDNPRNGGVNFFLVKGGKVINSSRDFDIRTIDYELALMPKDGVFAKNKVYVAITADGLLQYTVITPKGERVTDTITKDELNYVFSAPLTLEQFESPSSILKVILQRGHITFNPNKAALLSSLLGQTSLADFEKFKNNFLPANFTFAQAGLHSYNVIVDISDDNIWRLKVRASTDILVVEAKYVRQPPVCYLDLALNFNVIEEEDKTYFVPDVETADCHVLVIDESTQNTPIKVKQEIVEFKAFPLATIDRVSKFNLDFFLCISSLFDESAGRDLARSATMKSLFETFGIDLQRLYKNEEATLYEEEYQLIKEFVERCSGVGHPSFILEGAKLFEFADKRLLEDTSAPENRRTHYERLKAYAQKIMTLDFDLLTPTGTRSNTLLTHAMMVFRKNSDICKNASVAKSDIFLQKHFAFASQLLASIEKLPSTPDKDLKIRRFNSYFSSTTKVEFLAHCKSSDSHVAEFVEDVINEAQRHNELCDFLSLLPQKSKKLQDERKATKSSSEESGKELTNEDKAVVTFTKLFSKQSSARDAVSDYHPGTILTSELLANRRIMNDQRVTGAVLVELLKEQPALAHEAVRPSFWQSLLGTNISRKFSAEDIKQLIRDHGANVVDGIFVKRFRSLMGKLSNEDVAEILLEAVLNKEVVLKKEKVLTEEEVLDRNEALLKALPDNPRIAECLVSYMDGQTDKGMIKAVKHQLYVTLITHHYHFTTNFLMKNKKFAKDFEKIVGFADLYKNNIGKSDIEKCINEASTEEQKRTVANIILSRYHIDGKVRILIKDEENLALKNYVIKYADSLLLNGFYDTDLQARIREINNLSASIENLITRYTPSDFENIQMLLIHLENAIKEANPILKNKVEYIAKLKMNRLSLDDSQSLVSRLLKNRLNAVIKEEESVLREFNPDNVLAEAQVKFRSLSINAVQKACVPAIFTTGRRISQQTEQPSIDEGHHVFVPPAILAF